MDQATEPISVVKVEDMMRGSESSVGAISGHLPGPTRIATQQTGQTADIEEQEVALMLFSLSQGATQALSSKPTIRTSSHKDLTKLQAVRNHNMDL